MSSVFAGRVFLLACVERPFWATVTVGKYGLAVTYWRRAKWQYGVRLSLLLGFRRPHLRITTYSCPSVGLAWLVRVLDCVLPKGPR